MSAPTVEQLAKALWALHAEDAERGWGSRLPDWGDLTPGEHTAWRHRASRLLLACADEDARTTRQGKLT